MRSPRHLLIAALVLTALAGLSACDGSGESSSERGTDLTDRGPETVSAEREDINAMRYGEPVGDGLSLQASSGEYVYRELDGIPVEFSADAENLSVTPGEELPERLTLQFHRDEWDFVPHARLANGWAVAREGERIFLFRVPGEETGDISVPLTATRTVSKRLTLGPARPKPEFNFSGSELQIDWTEDFRGDMNNDGKIGPLDLNVLIDNFGNTSDDFEDQEAFDFVDPNRDGSVGPLDLNLLIDQFGASLTGYSLLRRSYAEEPDESPSVEDLFQGGTPTTGTEIVRIDGVSPEDNEDLTVRRKPVTEGGRNTYSLTDSPGPGFHAYTLVYYSDPEDSPPWSLPSQIFADRGVTTSKFLLERQGSGSVSPGNQVSVDVRLEEATSVRFARARVTYATEQLALDSCELVPGTEHLFGEDASGFCEELEEEGTAVLFTSRPGEFDLNTVQSGHLARLTFIGQQTGTAVVRFIPGEEDRDEFIVAGDPDGNGLPREVGEQVDFEVDF